MLFNSFEFAIFLPVVFLLYWFVFNQSLKIQNFFLLIVGYIFYGWWDWRFLFLIAFSTTLDFSVGLLLEKTENTKNRKGLFILSCLINLGFLGAFKYYNFFIDNFISAFEHIGYHIPVLPLKIILPVGISFYTFQSLSYTADVYSRKMKAEHDFISFAAFISFFPQLVAGPIERARHLLPQFKTQRSFDFDMAKKGLLKMLWGFFKKIVIADSLAVYVDDIFFHYQHLPASTLVIGAIYFAIQIYCDFSGYSSIAIGTAKLFGFSLMENFSFPYFSKNVAEFWRRWHISLSTWFRDYVYIPLGGSYGSKTKTIVNILITFTLSGFWHGANWTFIAWGFLNGLFILPTTLLSKKKNSDEKKRLPSFIDILQMTGTFLLITLTWIFFRSENMASAMHYIHHILSPSIFSYPVQHGMLLAIPLITILFSVEWIQKNDIIILSRNAIPVYARWSIYLITALTCLAFFKQNQTFIYFQF